MSRGRTNNVLENYEERSTTRQRVSRICPSRLRNTGDWTLRVQTSPMGAMHTVTALPQRGYGEADNHKTNIYIHMARILLVCFSIFVLRLILLFDLCSRRVVEHDIHAVSRVICNNAGVPMTGQGNRPTVERPTNIFRYRSRNQTILLNPLFNRGVPTNVSFITWVGRPWSPPSWYAPYFATQYQRACY